jgi:hypothetical protein
MLQNIKLLFILSLPVFLAWLAVAFSPPPCRVPKESTALNMGLFDAFSKVRGIDEL